MFFIIRIAFSKCTYSRLPCVSLCVYHSTTWLLTHSSAFYFPQHGIVSYLSHRQRYGYRSLCVVVPPGIEPDFPGWKPDDLTDSRWDQKFVRPAPHSELVLCSIKRLFSEVKVPFIRASRTSVVSFRAGRENRTLVFRLEVWSNTIIRYPQLWLLLGKFRHVYVNGVIKLTNITDVSFNDKLSPQNVSF